MKHTERNVFNQHAVKIAKDTLRMPDAMLGVMGGPSKADARLTLKENGYTEYEGEKL